MNGSHGRTKMFLATVGVEVRPSQPWSSCEPREEDDEQDLDPTSWRQHTGGAFSLHVSVTMSVWATPLLQETMKQANPF